MVSVRVHSSYQFLKRNYSHGCSLRISAGRAQSVQNDFFFVLQGWLHIYLEILVKKVDSSKGEGDKDFMPDP